MGMTPLRRWRWAGQRIFLGINGTCCPEEREKLLVMAEEAESLLSLAVMFATPRLVVTLWVPDGGLTPGLLQSPVQLTCGAT
jgi:hypothetical protein